MAERPRFIRSSVRPSIPTKTQLKVWPKTLMARWPHSDDAIPRTTTAREEAPGRAPSNGAT